MSSPCPVTCSNMSSHIVLLASLWVQTLSRSELAAVNACHDRVRLLGGRLVGTIGYNNILSACAQETQWRRALHLVVHMPEWAIQPDEFSNMARKRL